jgi:hypothetical protein
MAENNTLLMLVVSEAQHAIKGKTGDVRTILRSAMEATKDHWMCLDEDTQMLGAIAAAMQHFGEGSPEYEQLKSEVLLLRQFSALIHAAQSGLHVAMPEVDESAARIGIMKLWREVKYGEISSDAAAVQESATTGVKHDEAPTK